ncbi:hypothetical protein FQA39_LY05382 [Lamprigera yunnana]|nr:hypothetical protein FQA39_LY05382 [Lamprigera yunnana]
MCRMKSSLREKRLPHEDNTTLPAEFKDNYRTLPAEFKNNYRTLSAEFKDNYPEEIIVQAAGFGDNKASQSESLSNTRTDYYSGVSFNCSGNKGNVKNGEDNNKIRNTVERMETIVPTTKCRLKNYEVRSSTALVTQLQQTKQRNLNIDEYGRSIESLLADLTIAQAGDNEEAIATFSEANEKIAIDAFTRGICNREVRIVTRARNFKSLSEAINVAKEESVIDKQNSIFQMQKWRYTGFQRNGNRDHKIFGSRKQSPYKNTCNNPNYRNRDTNWHTNGHYNDKTDMQMGIIIKGIIIKEIIRLIIESINKAAQVSSVSDSGVQRVVKKTQIPSLQDENGDELNKENPENQLEFCEEFSELPNNIPNQLNN